MSDSADPLWPHFKPLWLDLDKAGEGVLVAGGYGLFLKQQRLLTTGAPPIVVPLERWADAAHRGDQRHRAIHPCSKNLPRIFHG